MKGKREGRGSATASCFPSCLEQGGGGRPNSQHSHIDSVGYKEGKKRNERSHSLFIIGSTGRKPKPRRASNFASAETQQKKKKAGSGQEAFQRSYINFGEGGGALLFLLLFRNTEISLRKKESDRKLSPSFFDGKSPARKQPIIPLLCAP